MVEASATPIVHTYTPSPLYQGAATYCGDDTARTPQWVSQHLRHQNQTKVAPSSRPLQAPPTPENTELNELPIGTRLLRNQYVIERLLDAGGFGITYLARDSLERQVVIKECFPEMLCCRVQTSVRTRTASEQESFHSVIRNFLKEARRLAKLKHKNIVDVHQVFEENGTAYLAMDYVKGVDLLTLQENRPESLTRETLQKILRDTLDALAYIHGLGILHRDISPDNIMIDDQGHVTLIDFGAARDNYLRRDRALTALLAVKDGYSPHEFYLDETDQQASSDLYSLAATFYHLIRGEAPVDSQRRLSSLASGKLDPYRPLAEQSLGFDLRYLETIDTCLSISQKARIQSADEWLDILESVDFQPAEPPEPAMTVELNGSIVDSIAAIVEETNKDVEIAQDETPARRAQKEVAQVGPQPEPVRQMVDIFGNPVDDVDTWLREQEDLLKSQRADVSNASDEDGGHDPDPDQQTISRGGMGAILWWFAKPLRFDTRRAQV